MPTGKTDVPQIPIQVPQKSLIFRRRRRLKTSPSMDSPFSVVFRDSVGTLNRDQMLALATLGMPIVALAHPYDVGLRRFPRADHGSVSYFDPILEFAEEKSLRPMSLEEIAAEVPVVPR